MAKGEILYIEDNFHNRRIVRKILERQDYVIYDAEDGLEGYNRLKELMPKVVLLDISLPTMDGIEIANRVKADSSTRDVVLIALTASAMAGDRERFLEAGCDDYLSKPFRALDLVEMVDYYMGRDYVPGESLSTGAKLTTVKEPAIKPIKQVENLPQPNLERKTKPKSEVMAEEPAPSPAVQPEDAAKSNHHSTNGNGVHPAAEPKPRSASHVEKSQPEIDHKLNSGISDMFDSFKPADPNKDEEK